MNEITKLQQHMEVAEKHAKYITKALENIKGSLPLTLTFAREENSDFVQILDALFFRYTKLQDLLSTKLFPLVIFFLGHDFTGQTYIDRLNILEKEGFLPSADEWDDMRKIRNSITHDYPYTDQELVDATNETLQAAIWLAHYWQTLEPKLQTIIHQYKEIMKK